MNSEEDIIIDYKLKFSIKINKLCKGDVSLGMFFDKHSFSTNIGEKYEYYLYICFIKWNIKLGWFLETIKED